MNAARILAIVLIIAGTLGLVYRGFSYTEENQAAKLGPLELTVKEKKTVDIPVWLSAGGIVLGVVLLVAGRKR
ncbi:hypothetical protein [Chitinimonas koreensis]|uniref:hypothetical protein n=1 Tax=Chitinimonas koreensis TaxID=356302 RepID=UPI000414FE13|nr:hypothetical protein [Chitinimonas koreensis]QNM97912.1 hypothetical protein H9L41_06535 [Chitinimonas koreensis]